VKYFTATADFTTADPDFAETASPNSDPFLYWGAADSKNAAAAAVTTVNLIKFIKSTETKYAKFQKGEAETVWNFDDLTGGTAGGKSDAIKWAGSVQLAVASAGVIAAALLF